LQLIFMGKIDTRFGDQLRRLRLQLGIGLSKLARAIGISPTYLSKIERGELPPPAERQVVAIAKILGQDADVLLAMAGRIRSDLSAIIKKHPSQYAALVRALRNTRESDLCTLSDALVRDHALLHADSVGPFTIVEMKRSGASPEECDRQIAMYKEMLARIDCKPLTRSKMTVEAKIGNRRIDLLLTDAASQRSKPSKILARVKSSRSEVVDLQPKADRVSEAKHRRTNVATEKRR
jgi:transcriptional regulator with XRE-family HTH domain